MNTIKEIVTSYDLKMNINMFTLTALIYFCIYLFYSVLKDYRENNPRFLWVCLFKFLWDTGIFLLAMI